MKQNREDDIKSRAIILIVDDDPDITLTFKLGLEENGFAVTVFNRILLLVLMHPIAKAMK